MLTTTKKEFQQIEDDPLASCTTEAFPNQERTSSLAALQEYAEGSASGLKKEITHKCTPVHTG